MNEITLTLGGSLRLMLEAPPPAGGVIVTLRYGGFCATAKGDHMAYKLPAGNQVEVRVDYVDAHGNPAVVDGLVTWDTSNPALITVTADADQSQLAIIATIGGLGTAQVAAIADADLGTGVRQVITTFDVEAVPGEAVAGTISPVGDSEPIP